MPRLADSRDSVLARGIGVALTERSGGGGQGAAAVKVHLDGSVIVFFASTDIGQGTVRRSRQSSPRPSASRFRRCARSPAIPKQRLTTLAASATGPFREPAGRRKPPPVIVWDNPCRAGPALDNAAPRIWNCAAVSSGSRHSRRSGVTLQALMQRLGRSIVGEATTLQPQTGTNVERTSAAHFVEVEVDRETGKSDCSDTSPPMTSAAR